MTFESQTSLLVPFTMLGGGMMCVVLPTNDEQTVLEMQKIFDREYNVFFVYSSILNPSGEKVVFIRISAQIYLQLSDFERLAALVLSFLRK